MTPKTASCLSAIRCAIDPQGRARRRSPPRGVDDQASSVPGGGLLLPGTHRSEALDTQRVGACPKYARNPPRDDLGGLALATQR